MQKKKIIALIISIIILITVVVGISYAYLRKTPVQTNDNVISTLSCLQVSITDLTEGINLDNAIPISDANGLKTPGYSFKIKNNCNTSVLAEINLESLAIEAPAEAIGIAYIKYSLNNSTPALVSSKTTKTATITGATSKNLLMVMLNKQEEQEYNLKLWINESATYAQAFGKVYQGKIVIVGNGTTQDCLTKPSEFTNAESGTLLAALNNDNYCLVNTTLTNPGESASLSYEKVLSSTPDDYGTSYYFRGAVENNYVVFAGMCWRIVRITGNDGTNGDYNNATKLVLYSYNTNGAANPCTQSETNNAFARYTGTTFTSKFNATGPSNAYVGYMYGTPNSSTYEAEHENITDSTILTNLKTWYDAKLRDYNDNYLADTIWCNDKRIAGDSAGDGIGTSVTYYAPRERINTGSPTLKCGSSKTDNIISKFTASETTYGNGKLKGVNGEGTSEYKIGLLTNDELLYAGAKLSTANSTYYLNKNATGTIWYTLSPSSLSTTPLANVLKVNTNGGLDGYGVTNNYAIRPSISLKSSVKVTGSGTSTDPYVVQNVGEVPSTYQEVEYIESTGTQYIDTGFSPTINTSIVIKATYDNNTLLGVIGNSNTNAIAIAGSSQKEYIRYFQSNGSVVRENVSNNDIYELTINKTSAISTINGNSTSITYSPSGTTTDGYTLYLFARNNAGNASGNSSRKVYYFKIYESGTLVRDFVPCYRKSDNVIGLYDLVTNEFYTNSGTGTFIKGANV